MSDADAPADEGGEGGGAPVGVLALVGAIVFLVAISGMFAIGFIPPVVGHHTTTTRGTAQFITITTGSPPVTQTVTSAATTTITGGATTVTQSGGGSISTTVITATSDVFSATSTVYSPPSTTTVTQSGGGTTIVSVPVTTTATTTTTTTTTSTVTTTPTNPFNATILLASPGSNVYYPGESFTILVNIANRLPSTSLSLYAYQPTPNGIPDYVSFFPQVPENVQVLVGASSFRLQGTISPNTVIGTYEVDVIVSANSPLNGYTQYNQEQQFVLNIGEPLQFTGYSFPGSNSQFGGSCFIMPYQSQGMATWVWQCGINAAPGVNGTVSFTVNNLSTSGICVQAEPPSSSTLTGLVKMNPYPFCPGGGPGVFVPPAQTGFVVTYLIESGSTAGVQSAVFTFTR